MHATDTKAREAHNPGSDSRFDSVSVSDPRTSKHTRTYYQLQILHLATPFSALLLRSLLVRGRDRRQKATGWWILGLRLDLGRRVRPSAFMLETMFFGDR